MPHLDNERVKGIESFAKYVSVLPWFNSNVLHKLYFNIFQPHDEQVDESYEARAIICADLLHSPYVDRVNYNVFVMFPELQDILRIEMQARPEIIREMGKFMLAYAVECREHFLGPKYIESYRIEGEAILNPEAAAGRIARNIVNRLNQIPDLSGKKNTVAYYLNNLRNNSTSPDVIRLLEGIKNLNPDTEEVPDELKTLKPADPEDDSITIKLPAYVKESILKKIEENRKSVNQKTLHALIIGINNYASERIFPLKAATSDAQRLDRYLLHNKMESITYQPVVQYGSNASRQNVIRAVRAFANVAESGDTFLFYFAGYGGVESSFENDKKYQGKSLQPPERLPFLVCHDTLTGSDPYGLSIPELQHLFSKFPRGCTCVAILDCGFDREAKLERGSRLPGSPSIRSLAWQESLRPEDQFVWNDDLDISSPQDKYTGIVMYAGGEYENVYDDEKNGFTPGMITALEKQQNNISYRELISGQRSITFSNTNQSPHYETKGLFTDTNPFLQGFLTVGSSELQKRIQETIESNSSELNLSGMKLAHIPEEIWEMTNLTTLDISQNEITEIPAQIGLLKSLELLAAHDNPISIVDDNIGELKDLSTVLLYKCKLKTFPKGLLRLKGLKNLQLEGNQIKWIPIDLKDLPVLGQIDIRNNPILNLPEDLRKSSVTELIDFYYQWEPDLYSNQKKPFVLLIGIDYDSKLSNLKAELETVEQTLHSADMDCKVLYNPNTIDIFGAIYQQQQVMSILHIAAFKLDELLGPDKVRHSISNEDVAEMFKCIRPTKFKDQLLVLNYCENADLINEHLIGDLFDMAIGMEEKVGDELAFAFSQEFYSQLVEGNTLNDAFRNTQQKLTTYE